MNINDPIVSIIIPVYNAEKFLRQCIKSVMDQTFYELEIILIDDGSTDKSGLQCDEYVKMDNRISVIHKENEGVSKARESGLCKAKGKYIAYIDADDYIDKNYIKVLYNDIQKFSADIACCDCTEIKDGIYKNSFRMVKHNRIIKSKEDYIKDYEVGNELYGSVVWGKLIKKDVLEGKKFKNICFGEDTVYMIDIFMESPITVLNTYKGYYYVRNKDSVTIRYENSLKKFIDYIYTGEALWKGAKDCKEEILKKNAVNEYANRIYTVIYNITKHNDKGEYEKNYNFLCEHIKNISKDKELRWKMRCLLNTYKKHPNLFWYLFSCLCVIGVF